MLQCMGSSFRIVLQTLQSPHVGMCCNYYRVSDVIPSCRIVSLLLEPCMHIIRDHGRVLFRCQYVQLLSCCKYWKPHVLLCCNLIRKPQADFGNELMMSHDCISHNYVSATLLPLRTRTQMNTNRYTYTHTHIRPTSIFSKFNEFSQKQVRAKEETEAVSVSFRRCVK